MRLDCGCRKALDFDSVFIKPKRSKHNTRDFVIERRFKMLHTPLHWTGVPIIASNMDHTGTVAMLEALAKFNCMTALHKFHTVEDLVQAAAKNLHEHMWISTGMSERALKELILGIGSIQARADWAYIPRICVDVANGYSQDFDKHIRLIRKTFPSAMIMAGNVATYEMTEQLLLSGADIVKVGIGPGSVCTTRKMTGVGYPQLSAIDECADAAHGLGGYICADGGCENPGHVAKALAAGADFVMLGGMLAGHDECAGERIIEHVESVEFVPVSEYHFTNTPNPIDFPKLIEIPTVKDVITGIKFRGMSSEAAQIDHYGSVKEYRASEGKEVVVPYKGPVKNVIKEILGGLRSCMTYIGAKRLKDIPKCSTMVPTNKQLNGMFS